MGDRRTARIVGTLGLLLENGVPLPTAEDSARCLTKPDYVAAVIMYRPCEMAEISLTRWRNQSASAAGGKDAGRGSSRRPCIHCPPGVAFYEHKLGLGLDRLMGDEPATIVVVSVVIGTLIVSIMSALLSITELRNDRDRQDGSAAAAET
jgi:general secretion pathway protein F